MKQLFLKHIKLAHALRAVRSSGINTAGITKLLPVSLFREIATHNPDLAERILTALTK